MLALTRFKNALTAIAVVAFSTLGLLFFGVSPAEAAPGTTATIKVGTSGTRVRSTLDIKSETNIVGGLHNGATVRVYCVTNGPWVTGPYGTTDAWNRIGNRRFVSSSFTGIKAGPSCFDKQTSQPTESTSGARVDAKDVARVRSEPSIKALIKYRYANGTEVKLSCKTFAEDRWWVKLASGAGYIASELVSGIPPKLKQCEDKAPRESNEGNGENTQYSQSDRSEYSYHFYIPIGDLNPTVLGITPQSITASYLRNFDQEFQFSGCGPSVEEPKTCYLNVGGFHSPVRITAIWETGFELKSLIGHPEGPDRYIDFNIVSGKQGVLYLDVNAYGKTKSILTNNPAGIFVNNQAVFIAWHTWADELARQHGLRTIDYVTGKKKVGE